MAFGVDFTGKPFDLHMAAVELINLVRPTVAVSWYIVFAALALHEHPGYREKLRTGDDAYAGLFVQEVRRFYPFAPWWAPGYGLRSTGGATASAREPWCCSTWKPPNWPSASSRGT